MGGGSGRQEGEKREEGEIVRDVEADRGKMG